MITVTNAWTQQGWSPNGHLIDDSRMAEVVGRDYATVEHARRAVAARADERGYPSFEYVLGDKLYRYDGSPTGIPGRHVRRITEIGPA